MSSYDFFASHKNSDTWKDFICSRTEIVPPRIFQMVEDFRFSKLDPNEALKRIYFLSCACPYCDRYLYKQGNKIYCRSKNCFILELITEDLENLEYKTNLMCYSLDLHRRQCQDIPKIFLKDGILWSKCLTCSYTETIKG